MNSKDVIKYPVTVFFSFIAVLVLLGLLIAFFIKLLWNGCLVGAIDGVNEITFLQAWGLNILAGLMFRTSATFKDQK